MGERNFWRNMFWEETNPVSPPFKGYQLNSFGKTVLPWVLWFAKLVTAERLLKWFLKMDDPELEVMFTYWNDNLPMWMVPELYPNYVYELNVLNSKFLTQEVFNEFFWSPSYQENMRINQNRYYVPFYKKRIKQMFEWSIKSTDLNVNYGEPISVEQQQVLAETINLGTPEIVVVEKFTNPEAITVIVNRIVETCNKIEPTMGYVRSLSSLGANPATSKENISKLIKTNVSVYSNFTYDVMSRSLNILPLDAVEFLFEHGYIQMAYEMLKSAHLPDFNFRFLLMCEYFKPANTFGEIGNNPNMFKEQIQTIFGVKTWSAAVNIMLKETGYGNVNEMPLEWKEDLLKLEYGPQLVR